MQAKYTFAYNKVQNATFLGCRNEKIEMKLKRAIQSMRQLPDP